MALRSGFRCPSEPQRLEALGGSFSPSKTFTLTKTESYKKKGLLTPELTRILNPTSYQPLVKPENGDWLAEHEESGQSFEEWLNYDRNAVGTDKRDKIYLVPMGEEWGEHVNLLTKLKDYAEAFFNGLNVVMLDPMSLKDKKVTTRENRNTHNEQYLAKDLMNILSDIIPNDAYCITGVTMTDLYPRESWNFVFGMASLRNRTGVYSFCRYDPEFVGERRTTDYEKIILMRSCKVMSHEICHQFGMHHCIYYQCIMNGSNHLEESDRKPFHLCPICYRKLHYAIGYSVTDREKAIKNFLSDNELPEVEWYEDRIAELVQHVD